MKTKEVLIWGYIDPNKIFHQITEMGRRYPTTVAGKGNVAGDK
jgi:hypothetical protein